ncbi:MAG: putative zinc-binding metallopeptidase [Capnocytophaga sp.]|nr:putative zinc-binding metallopeptidase [Capnocytophaga sp.]
MKYNIFLIAILFVVSCNKEKLSQESVVDSNIVQRNQTELDTYIQTEFVQPYNIAVEYRWNTNTAPKGSYAYPPSPDKVQQVLKTIKALWLELYTLPNLGGANFFKGKNPIRIYMYGGKNLDRNGVELIHNPDENPIEMHLYDVNDFDPKDPVKVFILMRTVHHQFAKRLMELLPYDRDKFAQISASAYLSDTADLPEKDNPSAYLRSQSECSYSSDYRYMVDSETDYQNLLKSFYTVGKTYSVKTLNEDCTIIRTASNITAGTQANDAGFYTIHSMLSPEDDFAEIISANIMHTAAEITAAQEIAKTPDSSSAEDTAKAAQAYAALTQKQAMVEEYFKKEIKIDLKRLQLFSIQQIKTFLNQ